MKLYFIVMTFNVILKRDMKITCNLGSVLCSAETLLMHACRTREQVVQSHS